MRWFAGLSYRSALVAAACGLAAGSRCASDAPPETNVAALAALLGQASGTRVDAEEIRWESSRGLFADALLGRRVLFLGRRDAEKPRDVLRAQVRVSYEGQPIRVVSVHTLTETPLADETLEDLNSQLGRDSSGLSSVVKGAVQRARERLGQRVRAPELDGPDLDAVRVPASEPGEWPPSPLHALIEPRIAGEGEWQSPELPWAAETEQDVPFRTTFLRLDPKRKDARVQFVALDLRRLELRMAAGIEQPQPQTGPSGRGALLNDPALRGRVRASFNGAWGEQDHGRVLDGHTLVPPLPGRSTLVLGRDGAVGFGVWPATSSLPRHVVALRQAADALNPAPETDATPTVRARSALCLAHNGHLYYAWSQGLSGKALAVALKQAGCHSGLELAEGAQQIGFFFHRTTGASADLAAHPAGPGLGLSPNFAQGSRHDFFYVLRRGRRDLGGVSWLPSPGVQPEPVAIPSLLAGRQVLGSLDVSLLLLEPDHVAYEIVAGSEEPLIAGRPAPVRQLTNPTGTLLALNLGHTTQATRLGLAFQAEATLPLRKVYGTLVIGPVGPRVVRSGEEVELAPGEHAVQLPELARQGQVTSRASERGIHGRRGALCVLPEGGLLVAEAEHDSSGPLALTLKKLGCDDVLDADRGSQHPFFTHRAGTQLPPQPSYTTTMLFVVSSAPRPRTFSWTPGAPPNLFRAIAW